MLCRPSSSSLSCLQHDYDMMMFLFRLFCVTLQIGIYKKMKKAEFCVVAFYSLHASYASFIWQLLRLLTLFTLYIQLMHFQLQLRVTFCVDISNDGSCRHNHHPIKHPLSWLISFLLCIIPLLWREHWPSSIFSTFHYFRLQATAQVTSSSCLFADAALIHINPTSVQSLYRVCSMSVGRSIFVVTFQSSMSSFCLCARSLSRPTNTTTKPLCPKSYSYVCVCVQCATVQCSHHVYFDYNGCAI